MLLKKGTLWELLVRTTEHALASGALLPVLTQYSFLEDSGVRFLVRIPAGLSRKDEARKEQTTASQAGRIINPFLPPDKELTVANISDTHLAVLNKFNVVDHHLLIITRQFEDQDMLLTLKDFEALWLCMAEFNGLGFYNGGKKAGASQQHKHIQIVPLPFAPEGPAIPIDPLLANTLQHGIGVIPTFPFLHSFIRLEPSMIDHPLDAADTSFEIYRTMLKQVKMTAPSRNDLTPQSMPYCFLMTRTWMLLVPRSQESFEDISLNSLAYAGSLFVRSKQQLDRLREVGPMKAITCAAMPKNA